METIEKIELLDDIDDQRTVRIGKRYLTDVQNPMEKFDNVDFARRYRFSKDGVMMLFDIIRSDSLLDVRDHCFPPLLQLTVALRFFATGHFQVTDGDLVGSSRHTARRSAHRISKTIAKRCSKFIYFPPDLQETKRKFFDIAEFPGVVGAIDGTHIPIVSPGGDQAEVFRNRKGFFSINVQAICDADRIITNLVARWPGSAHDSRIFENSVVHDEFEEGKYDGLLLGDNGYGCKTYLMTPLLNPISAKEKRYNIAHKKPGEGLSTASEY